MAGCRLVEFTSCVLVMICMISSGASGAKAAITCGRVLSSISPCIGYVQRGGAVPPGCCDGARALNNAARTTPDRQSVCTCIKSIVTSVKANPDLVNNLVGKCGLDIPYRFSPSLDCSKAQEARLAPAPGNGIRAGTRQFDDGVPDLFGGIRGWGAGPGAAEM
ncbi:hypothetical protein ACJIZ3_022225 [Penstemon smallii]|uniref:Non-specific lipid-transfer protein n=1 Tax=Penstemon smallii TaxID=265156 RepID=A0ABD3SPA9_9LAMI